MCCANSACTGESLDLVSGKPLMLLQQLNVALPSTRFPEVCGRAAAQAAGASPLDFLAHSSHDYHQTS